VTSSSRNSRVVHPWIHLISELNKVELHKEMIMAHGGPGPGPGPVCFTQAFDPSWRLYSSSISEEMTAHHPA
jgi:glycine cleavage system protein P-like pyridoxal-binding family